MFTKIKLLHSLNALLPILVILDGRVTETKLTQELNKLSSIVDIPSLITKLIKLSLYFLKHHFPRN